MVMARIILIAFTLLGFTILPIKAENPTDKSKDIPVEVTDFQVSLVNMMKWGSVSGGGIGVSPNTVSQDVPQGDDKEILFSLKCKNSTPKQTAVIYWESRFTDSKQHLVERAFKTKKKIKAGKDETIEEHLPFDLSQLPSPVKVGYRIVKIEFSDNSTWEIANKDDAESFNYKLYKLN